MIQKPPRNSFVSAKGPSVISGVALVGRTMVALSGIWRPPPNTQAPVACISALNASTALKAACMSSSDIWKAASSTPSWCTESMYCVIGISSSDGAGTVPAHILSTNGVLPNRHPERTSSPAAQPPGEAAREAAPGWAKPGAPKRGAQGQRAVGMSSETRWRSASSGQRTVTALPRV